MWLSSIGLVGTAKSHKEQLYTWSDISVTLDYQALLSYPQIDLGAI